jgi:hypothetical protein
MAQQKRDEFADITICATAAKADLSSAGAADNIVLRAENGKFI